MRPTIRVLAGQAMVRLGIRDVLPRDCVARIPVRDNGETLIALVPDARLILKPYQADRILRARQGAEQRLRQAAATLPREFTLIVVDAFRSRRDQESRWTNRIQEMTRRMPRATKHEMEDAAQRFTARPQASGHQTGGAFDVTLGDQQGTELDLGTHVKQATTLTRTKARGLNGRQASNRKTLIAAMQSAGFTNYPLEWWHFSYGDRLWAAYTRNKIAIYDVLDE